MNEPICRSPELETKTIDLGEGEIRGVKGKDGRKASHIDPGSSVGNYMVLDRTEGLLTQRYLNSFATEETKAPRELAKGQKRQTFARI